MLWDLHDYETGYVVRRPISPILLSYNNAQHGEQLCSRFKVSVKIEILNYSNSLIVCTERAHLPEFQISNPNSWIVTMWHFVADSLSEYAGEKFEIIWKEV